VQLDHHAIEIIWRFAIAAQLQIYFGPRIRRRQDFGNKLKSASE
jgi:hypothetical protein